MPPAHVLRFLDRRGVVHLPRVALHDEDDDRKDNQDWGLENLVRKEEHGDAQVMCVPTTAATITPAMMGIDIFLPLDLDPDFFPFASTATAWKTVRSKVKEAQRRGFIS